MPVDFVHQFGTPSSLYSASSSAACSTASTIPTWPVYPQMFPTLFANPLTGGRFLTMEKIEGRHQHARCTEAALKAMPITEGTLERMRFTVAGG